MWQLVPRCCKCSTRAALTVVAWHEKARRRAGCRKYGGRTFGYGQCAVPTGLPSASRTTSTPPPGSPIRAGPDRRSRHRRRVRAGRQRTSPLADAALRTGRSRRTASVARISAAHQGLHGRSPGVVNSQYARRAGLGRDIDSTRYRLCAFVAAFCVPRTVRRVVSK